MSISNAESAAHRAAITNARRNARNMFVCVLVFLLSVFCLALAYAFKGPPTCAQYVDREVGTYRGAPLYRRSCVAWRQ